MKKIELAPKTDEQIKELLENETRYHDLKSEDFSHNKISSMMGVASSTLRDRLKRIVELRFEYPQDERLSNKAILPGQKEPKKAEEKSLPKYGEIKRYIFTSAQNNTKVFKKFFNNLIEYANEIDAELHVGTYTYSHNNNNEFTVKRGTNQHHSDVWWDEIVEPYISDERIQIAPDLFWCGDWNISPTATDPVSSLDSYNGTATNIFPHAKLRQKAIPVQKGERVKRNVTTGTATELNYVQRKAGMKAEFDHVFSAIIVEVDSDGFWLHRQLVADSKNGGFYDLDIYTSHYEDEGDIYCMEFFKSPTIIHGDIHADEFEEELFDVVWGDGKDSVKNVINPGKDVLHDLLSFRSHNPHDKGIFSKFGKWFEGRSDVEYEIQKTTSLLEEIAENSVHILVPYSNHDDMLKRWLEDANYDFRKDYENAIYYLKLMRRNLEAIRDNEVDFSIWEWALEDALNFGERNNNVDFLKHEDDTYVVYDIEIGKHGHAGHSGSRGSLRQYRNSGKKIVVGHYHKAEIDGGAYSVGYYGKLWPEYTRGYSNWTHSFCIIYPNGKRTLVDIMKNREGEWKWHL